MTTRATAPPTLLNALVALLGAEGVLHQRDERLVYECDGYTAEKLLPDLVAFPRSAADVVGIVKLCGRFGVPFVPRGAGTGLAGGTLAVGGGVLIALTRMARILEINVRDGYAVVEPGVVNLALTRALAGTGYHYAPDPSSQAACTIGGNVATNSGGPHTLKYGVTVNHVLGAQFVLGDGSVVELGGVAQDDPGYDLTSLFVGSEGTFGVCTRVTVALTRDPEAGRTLLTLFPSVEAATECVGAIIAAGIVPAALEMLDRPMIGAVDEAFRFGFPTDAAALLIIEIDGVEAALDAQHEAIARAIGAQRGTVWRSIAWRTRKEPEYLALWRCRRSAFAAISRLSPTFCTQDGVVPRTKLPHILRTIERIGREHGLRIANVCHAGDGNIHPILLYDDADPAEADRVLHANHAILDECLAVGGSVSGEHGIGVEKRAFLAKLFGPDDLAFMEGLRHAIDPSGHCNPSKLLPGGGGCIERRTPGRHASA